MLSGVERIDGFLEGSHVMDWQRLGEVFVGVCVVLGVLAGALWVIGWCEAHGKTWILGLVFWVLAMTAILYWGG